TAQAGLLQALDAGLVTPEEQIVVMVTGSGLKDVDAAMQATGEAQVIEPNLDALSEVVERS
ncbi:MAG: threonine synthase, partial [Anaerolineales bacterium]